MKKPLFIRLVTNPVDRLSKYLKNNTTQNLQDWILAVMFLLAFISRFFILITLKLKIN